MVYNEKLADRIRKTLAKTKSVQEKHMFGGIAFMVHGKMCIGIVKDDLMVRLDPLLYDAVLKKPGCRPMDFTGRPMKGFVFVSPQGTDSKKDLDYWVSLALDFNTEAKASTKRKSNTRKKKNL